MEAGAPPVKIARHARDIPNEVILGLVPPGAIRTLWSLCDDLAALGYRTPIGDEVVQSKLVRSKMRRFINAGKVRGCTCGCRGDFRLT